MDQPRAYRLEIRANGENVLSYTAIKVASLAKRYKITAQQALYKTLGETLAGTFRQNFLNGLKKPDGAEYFHALRDISFEIGQGEVVGVIGRNGAGKSTLLKILSRITEPSAGTIDIFGRVGSLLEVGTGFHYELTGKENIYLSGAILGMKKAEITAQFDEIVAFAEVEKFINTPVKHYSSGMLMRLAFAVSAHLQPEILLIDEVLAVGDAAFQRKCLGKMDDVAKQGRTVLFVSHNMSAVMELCSRVLVLEKGTLVFDGEVAAGVETYFSQNAEDFEPAELTAHAPLRVNSVKINGGAADSVKSSDNFDVGLQLVGKNIRNPAMYLIIENVSGQTILHKRINSREVGVEVLNGEYELKVSLPALWLSPGVYSLYFKFIVPATEWKGTLRSERFMLEVRGELEGTGKSVLNPEVEWQIADAVSPKRLKNGKALASQLF